MFSKAIGPTLIPCFCFKDLIIGGHTLVSGYCKTVLYCIPYIIPQKKYTSE